MVTQSGHIIYNFIFCSWSKIISVYCAKCSFGGYQMILGAINWLQVHNHPDGAESMTTTQTYCGMWTALSANRWMSCQVPAQSQRSDRAHATSKTHQSLYKQEFCKKKNIICLCLVTTPDPLSGPNPKILLEMD